MNDLDRAAASDLERAVKSVLTEARRDPAGWAKHVPQPDPEWTGRDLVCMALLRFHMDREEAG